MEVPFEVGDTVRIKSGPFASFTGVVREIYSGLGELKVTVEVFGRATTVNVPASEAEKAPPPPPPLTSLN